MTTTTPRSPTAFYRSKAQNIAAKVGKDPVDPFVYDTAPVAWLPPIELHETSRTLILKIELPGMGAEFLEISLSHDVVEIAGERHAEAQSQTNGCYQSELKYGKFYRSIPLPLAIDPTAAQASFQDGVVMLVLPKQIANPQVLPFEPAQSEAACPLRPRAEKNSQPVLNYEPSYWFA
jgi:HSP20 family molecular chaperone IbpA